MRSLSVVITAVALVVPMMLPGQGTPDPAVPPLGSLVAAQASELRDVVQRYTVDRAALGRRYGVAYSPARRERFRAFTLG